MHFQGKNTLKSNLYYTPKHPLTGGETTSSLKLLCLMKYFFSNLCFWSNSTIAQLCGVIELNCSVSCMVSKILYLFLFLIHVRGMNIHASYKLICQQFKNWFLNYVIEGLKFSTTMDHYTSKRCLINCMRLVFLWYSNKLLVFLNWSYFYLSDSILILCNYFWRLSGNQNHQIDLVKLQN
jgi:hypothetical protein